MTPSNGSLVREKRALENQTCHLVLFTTFSPNQQATPQLKKQTKVTNKTQSINPSNVMKQTLENVSYIESAKLIPLSKSTKKYFIVQMTVLGPATQTHNKILMRYFNYH